MRIIADPLAESVLAARPMGAALYGGQEAQMVVSENLRIMRLAARVHGLIYTRFEDLNTRMIKIVKEKFSLFKKPKAEELEALIGELPILLLILALQEAEDSKAYPEGEPAEFFKSCLVHFFSTHYIPLYLTYKDPVKETMARVDWYLDGKGEKAEHLFAQFAGGLLGDKKGVLNQPLIDFTREALLPEVQKALGLAPMYKH